MILNHSNPATWMTDFVCRSFTIHRDRTYILCEPCRAVKLQSEIARRFAVKAALRASFGLGIGLLNEPGVNDRRLLAGADAKTVEDLVDMVLDRPDRDRQFVGNLLIGMPLDQ